MIKLRYYTNSNKVQLKYWLETINGKAYLCKSNMMGNYIRQIPLSDIVPNGSLMKPQTRAEWIFLRNKVEQALGELK